MSLLALAWRSLREHRLRNFLTIVAVAVSIVTFILLRTVVWAWEVGAENAAPDRIGTRHKVTFVMPLPKKYYQAVKDTPGVVATTFATWTDAKYPVNEREFFAALAVDPSSFLTVYDEVQVDDAVKRSWLEDRKGALVGHVLASKFGWKVGDRVRLTCAFLPYPGEMEFEIKGTYVATRKSVDQSMFLLHWDYFNELVPDLTKDKIGWIVSRIADPSKSADISKEIDRRFDVQEDQTITMSEGEMQKSFLGMASALISALDIISLVILVIMMLIVGNTIAMGVRDRTSQYAVMQAIGFLPKHILVTVLGEGLVLGALGGLTGLFLGWLFVTQLMGRFIEENLGSFFPYFRVTPEAAALALLLAVLVGAIAAALPAMGAARTNLVEAFRKVG
jgi:putative ABC transport system permease protein